MNRKAKPTVKQQPVAVVEQPSKPAAVVIGETIDAVIGGTKHGIKCAVTATKTTGTGIAGFLRDINNARKEHRASRLVQES